MIQKVMFFLVAFGLVTAVWLGFDPKMLQADNPNLILNPSVEVVSAGNTALPQDWFTDKYGSNRAVFTYPFVGINGGRSVKVELKSRTSGDAKWYFKAVAVVSGKEYVFKDFYKT